MPLIGIFLWAWMGFAQTYEQLSRLEKVSVDRGLELHKLVLEKKPNEKIIRNIYVYVESPFSKEDGFLSFANVLHMNTKREVILSYLQQKEGDVYDENLLSQSEQMILGIYYRSFAVILPVRQEGTLENQVDLLVVTRDTWSLRAIFEPTLTGTHVDALKVGLMEGNILGLDKSLEGLFEITKDTLEASLAYRDSALFGSLHQLALDGGLIWDRDQIKQRGWFADLNFGVPIIKENQEWGYNLLFSYLKTPKKTYDWEKGQARASVIRSFGIKEKHELEGGYGLEDTRSTLKDSFGALDSYVFLSYQYFLNEFKSIYNLKTLQLAENYRLGPQLKIELDFANQMILRSDQGFIRPVASVGYNTVFFEDAMFVMNHSFQTLYDGKNWKDNIFSSSLMASSPSILQLGRLVMGIRGAFRLEDRFRLVYTLGGSSGALRSVPTDFYRGNALLSANAEFRTKGIDLRWMVVGGTLFYDIGTAFPASFTQGVGAGMRILLVQFNRSVLRFDYSIPIDGPLRGFHNGVLTFGVGQVF